MPIRLRSRTIWARSRSYSTTPNDALTGKRDRGDGPLTGRKISGGGTERPRAAEGSPPDGGWGYRRVERVSVPPPCRSDALGLRGRRLLDRHSNEASPFGPGAVVITDALVTEEVLQNEPGVRAALADAAVRDRLALSIDAFAAVDLP